MSKRRHRPGEAACRAHRAPLLLFCEDDEAALCRTCLLRGAHRAHVVRGVRDAAEKRRVSCLPRVLPHLWATDPVSPVPAADISRKHPGPAAQRLPVKAED